MFRSDLPADGLPAVNGRVDETKVTPIRRILLNGGTTSVLTTNLSAGRYLLVCNLGATAATAHYSSGMVIEFNVGPTGAALAAPSVPATPPPAAAAAAAPAQVTPAPPKTGSAGLLTGQTSTLLALTLLAVTVVVVGAARLQGSRASKIR